MTNAQTTKTKHYLRATLTALGTILAATLLAGGVALAASANFNNPTPIQIVDATDSGPGLANPYPSKINVQGRSGNVSDVSIELFQLNHDFPDDVDVLLVGPQGQKALLMSDVGGNFSPNDLNFILDDDVPNSLPDNGLITSGFYRPTRGTAAPAGHLVPANFPAPAPPGPYAKRLSVFDGTDPNGTWKLFVIDDTARDAGQFAEGWTLFVATKPDTAAPKVASTKPSDGATGVSPSANVRAIFSEDMKATSVNGATFKLFKKGAATKLSAKVTYDATADRATLDPTNPLKRGVTYKAVVTTGAKDRAGNRLDQNSSLTGLQRKAWSFEVRN